MGQIKIEVENVRASESSTVQKFINVFKVLKNPSNSSFLLTLEFQKRVLSLLVSIKSQPCSCNCSGSHGNGSDSGESSATIDKITAMSSFDALEKTLHDEETYLKMVH